MVEVANRFVSSLSRSQVVAVSLVVLALIGIVDLATGFEIGVSVFYVGPVSLVAWYVNRRAAVVIALLSAATWLAADLLAGHVYSHSAIPVWNAVVRLGFFLIIAVLLDLLRTHLAMEQRLARTDTVTGVLNRRAFMEQLDYGLALARREDKAVAVAYVDLDDFKRVNDAYGHDEGDRALRVVAQALTESTRRTDIVARISGDEFALLLPGTDLAGAERLIGKAMLSLAEGFRSGLSRVTCSIGTVVFLRAPDTGEQAIKAADTLMYRVKRQGKNAVLFDVLGPDRTVPPGAMPLHTPAAES